MPTYGTGAKRLVTRRTFDMIFTPEANTGSSQTVDVSTRSTPYRSFTIYSGVQPTAQQVESNWSAYKNSNSICLAHYTAGVSFSYNASTLTYYFTNTTNSITTTALRTGTASWAIIWMATNVDVSLTTIPADGKFVVVPVTNTSGVGVIRYLDLATTELQAFTPYDGGLTLVES